MATGLVYDDRFLLHDTGSQHPERPARLQAIVERLRRDHLWDRMRCVEVKPVDMKWVERVHDPHYVQRLRQACELGERSIDSADSAIGPMSFEVAMLAAGGVVEAVEQVMRGALRNAFCAVRPPGHHAERDRSMGFCLLNNVAIAAEYLVAQHGLTRVAIIDFDVHHGNGTQHIFEHRPDVLYVSMHESPVHLYPGTGFAWESGSGAGSGKTLNLTLDPGAGDERYRDLVNQRVLPALEEHRPQFILLSAGFDAAEEDPLAHLAATPHGFAWMTRQFKAAAERHGAGRLVSVLEGGYDLRSLAESVSEHVSVLLAPDGHDDLMAMKAGV